jgi:hypothetical protein
VSWKDEELAYDGSSRPQTRELTPRERDILTRVLDGWWHKIIEIDAELHGVTPNFVGAQVDIGAHTRSMPLGALSIPTNEILDDPRLGWMRMSPEECQLLLNLREVLTPRTD